MRCCLPLWPLGRLVVILEVASCVIKTLFCPVVVPNVWKVYLAPTLLLLPVLGKQFPIPSYAALLYSCRISLAVNIYCVMVNYFESSLLAALEG